MSDLFSSQHQDSSRFLRIEADGGSRGNPGPAAYGTVVKDAQTGEVLAEDAGFVGNATNNVAEYHGLIAGLKLCDSIDANARIEAFMDSKLVVEQMSGRWKIKHESMKELAAEANRLVLGKKVSYQWVPRAENAHADRLANEAMDAQAQGKKWEAKTLSPNPAQETANALEWEPANALEWEPANVTEYKAEKPWSMRAPFSGKKPTTILILVRHGRTAHTHDKRMSGADGSDPMLSEIGLDDAARVAKEIAKIGASGSWAHLPKPEHIVASPMNRAQQTAQAIAQELKLEVETDEKWIEASFGDWEGKTLADVKEEDPIALKEWEGSITFAPPGGESLVEFVARSRKARRELVEKYSGKTIVSVSHATPVRCAVADALGATDEALWKMLVSPASISIVRFWGDETSDVLTVNSCSHLG